MSDRKPLKRSVALAVRHRDFAGKVLLVRRPESDDEFPGMWGLPAATCAPDESLEEAATRVANQKLGLCLSISDLLGIGSQERPSYTIEMTLYEAWADTPEPRLPADSGEGGVTIYTESRWGEASEIADSARNGSLCSQLLLTKLRIPW